MKDNIIINLCVYAYVIYMCNPTQNVCFPQTKGHDSQIQIKIWEKYLIYDIYTFLFNFEAQISRILHFAAALRKYLKMCE